MSFRKVFVKIKILFGISIIILLWISIPDLHFIHRRHPPNFVWICSLLWKLLCPQPESTYVCTYSHTDRQDRRKFLLLVLCSKTYETRTFIKRRFFFNHAITILPLFPYSICDEKVRKKTTCATISSLFLLINLVRLFVSDDYSNLYSSAAVQKETKICSLALSTILILLKKNLYTTCRNYFSQQNKKKKTQIRWSIFEILTFEHSEKKRIHSGVIF